MNYTKPAVAVLGEAVQVIQGQKQTPNFLDGGDRHIVKPAYDLDE
jgi:hypothetical protein